MNRYSASQLGTWTRCQMQWYYRYVEGIKSPPGVAALLGKGVDASVTANLQAKMAGSPLSFTEAQDVARDGVASAWSEEPPRVSDDDKIQDVGTCQDKAIVLAGIHHARVAPIIEPVALQQEAFLEPDGYDFTMKGYLDVVEAEKIRDTKTTGKKPDPEAADRGSYADQLTLYGMMVPDKSLHLDYLVNVQKPYQVLIEATERTELDQAKLLDKYQRMHMAVEAGIFQPTAADNWTCSQKWCGYWDRCPHGSRDAVLVPVSNLTRKVESDDDKITW